MCILFLTIFCVSFQNLCETAEDDYSREENSLFNASYLYQEELHLYGKRTIIDRVTILRNDVEETAERKQSPTRVIRAIASLALKWDISCFVILTEPRFVFIAREWQTFLKSIPQFWTVHFVVAKDNSITENIYNMYADLCIKMTIVLLNCNNLNTILRGRSIAYLSRSAVASWDNRFVIMGRCPPKFINQFILITKGIYRAVIIPVNTQEWIQGIVKMDNLTLSSIHNFDRNGTAWFAFPVHTLQTNSLVKSRMQYDRVNFGVFDNIRIIVHVHDYSELRPGWKSSATGIAYEILGHLQDFLKFELIVLGEGPSNRQGNSPQESVGRRGIPDMYIGTFFISQEFRFKFLPPIFVDGLNAFAAYINEPMKLEDIFTIFENNVWIVLAITICVCNMCFFLTYDGSPSFKNHPRLKNTSMPAFWRLFFFDSFVQFHLEYQQGPNVTTKWLLSAFNFFLFMVLNVFLIKFTKMVLDHKPVLPLSEESDALMYPERSILLSLDKTTMGYVGSDLLCPVYEAMLEYNMFTFPEPRETFEAISNGSKIGFASDHYGTQRIRYQPHVGKLKNPVCQYPTSIKSQADFLFFDAFSHMSLRLREVGILHAYRKRYSSSLAQAELSTIKTITFVETWFAFAIVGIGIPIALIAVATEIFVKRYT